MAAPLMATRSRDQLIDHLIAYHGAEHTGVDAVTAWTTKEIREVHADDHNRQRGYSKPARMSSHTHGKDG